MGPAYRIVSKRLVLRCFAPADAAEVRDLIERSRAHLAAWVPLPPPESLDGMVQRLRDLRARFDSDLELTYAFIRRDTAELIGVGSLNPTADVQSRVLGGWLRPDQGAAGLGTEAAAALVRTGFEVLQLQRLQIATEPQNIITCKLARRLGFQTDGIARPQAWAENVVRNQLTFELSANEYADSPAAAFAGQAFDALEQQIL